MGVIDYLPTIFNPFKVTTNYSFGLPLKNNFAEFAYYEGLFLPHEINRILDFWDDDKVFKAEVSGEEAQKEELRKSSVMGIDNLPDNGWLYQ
jgi:PKHD-type hydroxylase